MNKVRVYYPFHPLHEQELEVFVSARSSDGAVTIQDAGNRRLKIPRWMVACEAAQCKLSSQATLDSRALLVLTELLELHDDMLPSKEVCSQKKEKCREAALVTGTTGKDGTSPRDSSRSTNS